MIIVRSTEIALKLIGEMEGDDVRMASMEVDPELSDTLMQLSGYIFRAAINAGLRRKF